MCGISGFISRTNRGGTESLKELAERMANTLITRGPDDSGVWVDNELGVAFGHRRLSIIDLTPEGHQPMVSASGRYVIAYNGEVYNFLSIKADLEKREKIAWRGHSDTEVLLAAIERYGIDEAVQLFNGMFAFALWDREKRVITLGRDRLGKKPLYYGWVNNTLLFGSELKALQAHPAFNCEVERDSLAPFLRYGYIPAPYSIFKGIYKLEQGHLLTIGYDDLEATPSKARAYWSVKEAFEQGAANDEPADIAEVESKLTSLLLDSVKIRMISDVPLGAFLSGGIDSSLIVALMQAESDTPVKTYTIGFHEERFNEAKHAKAVAKHLGTDHRELYVTAQQALDVIPDLPALYDEPFADSSQVPTFLVSKMAGEHVTVCLSGDGGDESFGGYNRYFWTMSIWGKINKIPLLARRLGAHMLSSMPASTLNMLFKTFEFAIPKSARVANPGDKALKMAEILVQRNPMGIYQWLVSHYKEPVNLLLGAKEPSTALSDKSAWANVADFNAQMMYLDTITYLPDDILTKVDRASMGVSLETRAPLLDYRVVEFAARMPMNMKMRDGSGKWILRRILDKYVPRELIERPKVGFAVPIDSWLRGPLRDWAESLLDETRLKNEGFFDPGPIRKQWEEHLSGKRNWQYYLWDILMFQAWFEKYNSDR